MAEAVTEKKLQELVIEAARTMGLVVYHTFDSRRSEAGFPDLVIVGQGSVLFRELKSATGKVSSAQEFWVQALTFAGADVGVWRPEDWPDRITRELLALGRCRAERPVMTQAQLRNKLSGPLGPK